MESPRCTAPEAPPIIWNGVPASMEASAAFFKGEQLGFEIQKQYSEESPVRTLPKSYVVSRNVICGNGPPEPCSGSVKEVPQLSTTTESVPEYSCSAEGVNRI